jgi:hypothetical protein
LNILITYLALGQRFDVIRKEPFDVVVAGAEPGGP